MRPRISSHLPDRSDPVATTIAVVEDDPESANILRLYLSEAGFDTCDLALDLIVGPDLNYGLKDEDELRTFLEHGFITAKEEEAIWRAHEEVIGRIERREFPFDGAWLDACPTQIGT